MMRDRSIPNKSWRLYLALAAHRIERRLGRQLTSDEYERLDRAMFFNSDKISERLVCVRYPHRFRLRRVGGRLQIVILEAA